MENGSNAWKGELTEGGQELGADKKKIAKEELWDVITFRQGETFYTAKGLPFTYTVKGGELFSDRKKKSITRATFEQAYQKIQQDTEGRITGPKSLGCFGAPYVWAVFKALGLV